MTVRRKGNKFQVDITVDGTRYRESFTTQDAAEKRELNIKLGNVTRLEPKDDITLREMLDKTYARFWGAQASAKTHDLNCNSLCKMLGETTLIKKIDAAEVEKLQSLLRESGNSDSTINRKLSTLSKALAYAVDLGYLIKKPRIHFNKERNNRIRFLSKAEERNLLDYLVGVGKQDFADYFIVLLDTGARPSELRKVKPQDIQGDKLTLWETKNSHPRTIFMTDRVQSIIQRKPDLLLISKNEYRRVWDAARDSMGLCDDENFVPYICRHTCASRLIQQGISLVEVKEWLGHKSITTTLRYAHLAPDTLMKARDVLQKMAA